MARLSTEFKSVQQPFLKYAEGKGWTYIQPEKAFAYGKKLCEFYFDKQRFTMRWFFEKDLWSIQRSIYEIY